MTVIFQWLTDATNNYLSWQFLRVGICVALTNITVVYAAAELSNPDEKCDRSAKKTVNCAQPSNASGFAQVENAWFLQGSKQIDLIDARARVPPAKRGAAKNIILFVGDGMGVSTVTAARILAGQERGESGEENNLSFELFPHTALAKTYTVDGQTPDSAGTMTALMTGVKTNLGVIGLAESANYGHCQNIRQSSVISALELAELAGMSTGIISTARLTHATPAATYAKSPDRNWEDSSVMPAEAKQQGCQDIAIQLVEFQQNLERRYPGAKVDGLEVALGGGRRHFLPASAAFNKDLIDLGSGVRDDNRDLIREWRSQHPKGHFIYNNRYFKVLDWEHSEQVLGLFNPTHMLYDADRRNNHADEPSLSAMTRDAISLLDNNPQGFFLMVEGGRIDHAHHAGNAYNALMDTIEFSNAVSEAIKHTKASETLILVTADHSHVFTIAGYPKRGNPILGKVVEVGKNTPALALDNKPYTTLGYMNGLGFHNFDNHTNADSVYKYDVSESFERRTDVSKIDTTRPGFHQEALVPMGAETHGGEDVVIYGTGPGSHLVAGTLEQNVVFHIMEFAGDLFARARQHASSSKQPVTTKTIISDKKDK